MTASRFLVSATLIGLAGAAAPAAEIVGGFVDLRLSGGITAGDYDVAVSDNTAPVLLNRSDDGNFDENYRFAIDWVGSLGLRSYGGWIWGIGGSYNSHKGAPATYVHNDAGGTIATDDLDVMAWAADGFIGYALPIGEHLQLEVLPFIGAGRAYMDSPDVDGHL